MAKARESSKTLSAALICFIVVALTQVQLTRSLSCAPCTEETSCPVLKCVGGTHMGPCRCCQECAKQHHEECGGPFKIHGRCDTNLICAIQPKHENEVSENAVGICKPQSSIVYNDVVCEGSRRNIQCPRGLVIRMETGLYGRKNRKTCPSKHIRTTHCAADGVLDIIRSNCDEQNSCSIHASNSVFGDPCVGTHKYVEFSFTCQATNNGIRAIICERGRETISCPTGEVIEVESAVYGRKDSTTCPSEQIRTTHCAADKSLAITKAKCDGQNSCSVHASNSVFRDPCVGTFKYVEMRYSCYVPDYGIRTTICEHRSQTITCPPGEVIEVESAVYGRKDSSTCPHGPILTTKCSSARSQAIISTRCNGQNSCSIHARNSVFGDPCVGTFKYVETRHNCYVPYNGIRTVFCEHRSQTITCPAGKVIEVESAVYGRKDSSTCPHGPILTTKCGSTTSLKIVSTRCNGRNSCSIQARNSVFGDPCVGTFKYVEMVHSCVPPRY